MGDRGNIVVQSNNKRVYLYGHWSGTAMPGILKKALAKRWRWDDASYLTRIIFDVLTEGCHGEETGFGIGTEPPDNEHPLIVVDVDKQQVRFEPDTRVGFSSIGLPRKSTYSFEDYVLNGPEQF